MRELIEARGRELLCLPPCSLDLNPIEEAFSKIKAMMILRWGRSGEALVEAMNQALSAVTTPDARGFFGHCVCRLPGQYL